jgi:hypothetical protein
MSKLIVEPHAFPLTEAQDISNSLNRVLIEILLTYRPDQVVELMHTLETYRTYGPAGYNQLALVQASMHRGPQGTYCEILAPIIYRLINALDRNLKAVNRAPQVETTAPVNKNSELHLSLRATVDTLVSTVLLYMKLYNGSA